MVIEAFASKADALTIAVGGYLMLTRTSQQIERSQARRGHLQVSLGGRSRTYSAAAKRVSSRSAIAGGTMAYQSNSRVRLCWAASSLSGRG